MLGLDMSDVALKCKPPSVFSYYCWVPVTSDGGVKDVANLNRTPRREPSVFVFRYEFLALVAEPLMERNSCGKKEKLLMSGCVFSHGGTEGTEIVSDLFSVTSVPL